MWISPSFFGKPWICPRSSDSSQSTQMNGTRPNGRPSKVPLRVTYASWYWPLAGSSLTRGSWSAAEHQSQKKNVQLPSPRGEKPVGHELRDARRIAVKSTAMISPE